MARFVTRQQSHRAIVRRVDPTRREPGLLDSVLNPVASHVVEPVAKKVVAPVVASVVEPVASSVIDPVVGPLVAPLTQGSPAQPTQPPSPPSGGSSGGNSNGGAGNSGNGGSGGGSGNGNGNGNNGNGGNGNGNGNNGGDGGGDSGGSDQGSSGGSGSGSNSGGSDSTGSGSVNSGITTGGSGGTLGGNSATGNSQGATSIGSDQTPTGTAGASGTSPSSDSKFLTTGQGVPVNAGSDPNPPGSTDDPATGSTAFVPGSSGIGTPGSTGNGNNGGGDGGGGDIHGNGATTNPNGGLSKGAAAGIAIAILAVAGIVIFLIIRRQRKHRNARRRQWWSARNGAVATYNDDMQADTFNGARRSVRSSFETTVDHSQTPRLDLNFEIPSLPPMAQLRREPVLINLDTPAIGPQVMVTDHESQNSPSRFSVGTMSSIASSDLGQWLIVSPNVGAEAGQRSPMSVRPFSPTEAFAFPKPPAESSGSSYSSPAHSTKGVIQDLPSLPVPGASYNPFDDPAPAVAPAPAGKIQKVPSPINVAAANPFVDPLPNLPPEPNTPSAVHPEFMEVETIKRPFLPTLSDEVMVEVGDNVKILQMFDDGWSLVEKNPILCTDLAAGKEKKPQVGLIPIDCFRDVGQGVNEFIASKRVSSYSQTSTAAGL